VQEEHTGAGGHRNRFGRPGGESRGKVAGSYFLNQVLPEPWTSRSERERGKAPEEEESVAGVGWPVTKRGGGEGQQAGK